MPADLVAPLGVDVLRRREVGLLFGAVHEQEAHLVHHLEDLVRAVLASPIRHVQNVPPLAVVLVLEVPAQLLEKEREQELIHGALEEHLVGSTVAAIRIDGVHLDDLLDLF